MGIMVANEATSYNLSPVNKEGKGFRESKAGGKDEVNGNIGQINNS